MARRLRVLGPAAVAALALVVAAIAVYLWLRRPIGAPEHSPCGPEPMHLADFPRPPLDNGRGVHWIPTTRQTPAQVDRFVREAEAMGIRWVVFLNDEARIGDNDYLVRQLVARGMMPVMRVLTHRGAPLRQDLTPMVRHYRQLGVWYFQLYNEPNLPSENQDRPPDVGRYLDLWLPAARQVLAGGGLPGIGALAPDAEVNDLLFLRQLLDGIARRGEQGVLNCAWLSVHNYLLGPSRLPLENDPGFQRLEQYDAIVRAALGRSLPLIGTEGGLPADRPPLRNDANVERLLAAYAAAERRSPPANLVYSYWLIANELGGGKDPAFSHQALFRPDGVSPLVGVLKRLARDRLANQVLWYGQCCETLPPYESAGSAVH